MTTRDRDALAEHTNAEKERSYDLQFIRSQISVREIAKQLQLDVSGNRARCWRVGNHQHSDRSPSVSFTKRNYFRCFVCDDRAHSNIDLVMAVLDCELSSALAWIAERFEVPRAARGKHINRRALSVPRVRAGVGTAVDDLVRAGVWANLSKEAKAVLPVVLAFIDPAAGVRRVVVSLRALRRYANLSFDGVSKAIRELENVALLTVERSSQRGVVRGVSTYVLHFENPSFVELAREISKRFFAEMNAERTEQQMKRAALEAKGEVQTC